MEYFDGFKDDCGPLSTNFVADVLLFDFFSITCGWMLRRYAGKRRQWFGFTLGTVLIFLFCGPTTIYFIFSVVFVIFWLIYRGRHPAINILVISALLGLRVMYRYSNTIIGISTSETASGKAMHMYFTLRCISAVVELTQRSNTEEKSKLKIQFGIFEVVSYLFFPPGLCIGPFYTFKTYIDSIATTSESLAQHPYLKFARIKFFRAIFLLALFFFAQMNSGPILEIGFDNNYKDKCVTMQFAFIILSMLLSTTFLGGFWNLGETCCIIWGVGGYDAPTVSGAGPTKAKKSLTRDNFNYNTISNGEGEIWFTKTSISSVARTWNASVQWFLYRYFYADKSMRHRPRVARLFLAQLVNYVWHGGRPGFALASFLMSFLILFDGFLSKITPILFTTNFGTRCANMSRRVISLYICLPYFFVMSLHPIGLTKDFLLSFSPFIFIYSMLIFCLSYLIEIFCRKFTLNVNCKKKRNKQK